jgi:hypothetical protein
VTDWKFVVATAAGDPIAELTGAMSRRVTWRRDAAADAAWTMDGDDPSAVFVEELLTDLLVYRDRTLMFRGRIGTSSDDIDEEADSHQCQFAAVDYRQFLTDLRFTNTALSYTADSKDQIAWALIAHTQALSGGNLGITNHAEFMPGLHDRDYDQYKSIGEAITQLGQTTNGFEWEVDAHRRFQLWAGQRGVTRDFVAHVGPKISKLGRAVNPADYRNVILGRGDPDTTTPYEAAVADIATRPEGRMEQVHVDQDLKEQDTVEERLDHLLDVAQVLQPNYTATVAPDEWDPEVAWVGDTTGLVVQRGRLSVDIQERVEEVSVEIDDDGEETIQLTYGQGHRANLAHILRRQGARLHNLERR